MLIIFRLLPSESRERACIIREAEALDGVLQPLNQSDATELLSHTLFYFSAARNTTP